MQATSNIPRAITTLGKGLVDLLWPPSCLGCGVHVETAAGLCPPCWARARFITGLACTSCGLPLPGSEDMAVQCDDCRRHPPPWTQGVATALYDGPVRQLVLGLKHGDRLDLAHPLGNWLARTARPLITPDTLVAPVPLHWWRRLKRRSDQAALLAARVVRREGGILIPDLLVRSRATPSQGHLGRDARFANLAGALRLRAGRQVTGRRILLIDDVMTSGATLSAATLVLQAAGAARVDVAVLARVPPGRLTDRD